VRLKKIVFLLAFAFISILVATGSFDLAVVWTKTTWAVIEIATITPGKLILRSIFQDIFSTINY
jgi:hypothetical protein